MAARHLDIPDPRSVLPSRAADLAAEVARALRSSGHLRLQEVEVVAHGGKILLRGWVPSYHLKQLAHARALTVPGVSAVRNELTVLHTRGTLAPLTRDR
jgi:osmotically-inducible protein OsmY